jgi:hypothetical protein
MKTNKLTFGICLLAMATFGFGSAMAQTETPTKPNVYEVNGAEMQVSELPVFKGRWYNPRNNASQIFKVVDGTVFMWNGRSCGESILKVIKAYQDEKSITIETSPPKDLLRCGTEHGMVISFDKSTKIGSYVIRASKDTREIANLGKVEID